MKYWGWKSLRLKVDIDKNRSLNIMNVQLETNVLQGKEFQRPLNVKANTDMFSSSCLYLFTYVTFKEMQAQVLKSISRFPL